MRTQTILGLRFRVGAAEEVVSGGLEGGLVVIPSAPVLVRMTEDAALREALLGAHIAITDSGLMVLLWRLIAGVRLERVSGLEYLQLLLRRLKPEGGDLRPEDAALDSTGNSSHQNSGLVPQVSHAAARSTLWVMPTVAARDRNLAWLQASGHATRSEDCYVAPLYPPSGPLSDCALLDWVRGRQPQHIIICLGGGVQERLGYFLIQQLKQGTGSGERGARSERLPGIHCVGAAIGFLSGDQVRIPMWADYLYLGWLFRCISAPRHFVPRYWKAARLVVLLSRYGKDAPPV